MAVYHRFFPSDSNLCFKPDHLKSGLVGFHKKIMLSLTVSCQWVDFGGKNYLLPAPFSYPSDLTAMLADVSNAAIDTPKQ